MKNLLYIVSFIFFVGCIEEYTPTGIEEVRDLLVIEGTVTNGESIFKLSRSVGLSENASDAEVVYNASVYIDKDDGTHLPGIYAGRGTYVVETGDLDAGTKYRLYISLDGEEYFSDFLSPIFTPEIDSISYIKKGQGETVYICVNTHDSEDQSRYYLWSYKEIWEVKADLYANYGYLDGRFDYFSLTTSYNTYYCWGRDSSKIMLLASSDKLSENIIYQKRLLEMLPSSDKISNLYYIKVNQKQIRKEAYDYYSNIQKNIEQTGSIFTPVPSEMKGNIRCITNPDLPVIGYVDVTTTTMKEHYISYEEGIYEPARSYCASMVTAELEFAYPVYAYFYRDTLTAEYAPYQCVDCRMKSMATKVRPDFWPNEHY